MTRCPPNVKCRGVVPALSHIMLHSDTLANEFNDILNAVEIFAPFQPLDPAVVFYAPLQFNTRDLRLSQDTFERNSEAWYLDGSGIYRRKLVNQARFENSRLLMESATTNKCENYNAEPDSAAENIITSLSPGATFERIQDVSQLQAAGLSEICTSGFVWHLNNQSAAGESYAQFEGFTLNTNPHTMSAFWRGTGQGYLRLQGVAGTPVDLPGAYEREIITQDPPTTTQRMRIYAWPGADLYFVLNQFEEGDIATSPIITEGTAGQRAIDRLTYVENWFNQTQGMTLVTLKPLFDLSSQIGDRGLLNLSDATLGLLYHDELFFKTYDGVNTAQIAHGGSIPGDIFFIAIRWLTNPAELQIGLSKNGNTWQWVASSSYDGAFAKDSLFRIGRALAYLYHFADVQIYNEDKGTAWIEGNYPP